MRALVVECRQPVDAGDRAVGQPGVQRSDRALGRDADRPRGSAPWRPACPSFLTSASPTPPSSSMTTTRAPSRTTPVSTHCARRTAAGRHRDAPREGVDGRQVALDDRRRAAAAAGAAAARGIRLSRRCGPAAAGRRRREAGLAADPAGDEPDGREVAQLEGVVAVDAVVFAHRGEDLGLLDGVDAEVGLEVELGVEQVGGVASQLGDDVDDLLGDLVGRDPPGAARPAAPGAAAAGAASGGGAATGRCGRRRRRARGGRPCRGSSRRRGSWSGSRAA